MALRMIEFLCSSCNLRFEFLAQGEEEIAATERPCKQCGSVAERVISAPGLRLINRNNSDFFERHKPRMRKRSHDHFMKHGRDEAIDRERAQLKKYLEPR